MTGWKELQEAFWAALEEEPDQRARHSATLAAIDPALPARLDALLAADGRGETLLQLFQSDRLSEDRPTRFGPYEVTGVLGRGGMGDVYRALDSRLHREVAIKVLPSALTSDRARLARFEHEAQVLASLNHRHIAQLYGLEESGSAPALIMELVEGPTLAAVIAAAATTPIPLTQALTIARQVADGLDAAHEKGIIHRDLKPGNVALTPAGEVKILDFGVAKSLEARGLKPSVSTDVGVLLGTPAYMSPEQARGLPVDKRADVWAFGCLLYELLTGRQPFSGVTPSDSLAAVLEHHPDLTILPARTPAAVRSLLRHCLEKDPKHRLRDIADARLAIDDALDQPDGGRIAHAGRGGGWSRPRVAIGSPVFWALTILGLVAIALVATRLPIGTPPGPGARRVIVSVVLPRGMRLAGSDLEAQGSESRFAVSPDGKKLALIAADETGRVRLWLRDLAWATFQPLPETDDASFPFWSPDSDAIGFVAAGKLKAIRTSGGGPLTVSEAGFRTGSWSRDGLILFAPAGGSALSVVSAAGSVPRPATMLDRASGEVQHGYPAFLPDGRHFLYFSMGSLANGALDPRGIYLASLDDASPAKLLIAGATQPRYANGHLLFVRSGTLMAQPFDAAGTALRGTPFPLVEDMKLATAGATGATAAFSVSDAGVLAYQAALPVQSCPVAFDRDGRPLAALTTPADYSDVALSPDGTKLAVSVMDPARSTRDLWVYEAYSGRGQRLSTDAGDEFAPVWSPDGSRLLFSAVSSGLVSLSVLNVSRVGDPVRLDADTLGLGKYASDWSRDGRYVMYIGGGRAIAKSDLWVAPLAVPRKAYPLLDSTFVETHGHFAPSNEWFVYSSNETGQLEVYADRFPTRGAKQLVSTGGGGWPRWSHDGREIFYLSPDNRLMSVGVDVTRERLGLAAPRPLFAARLRPSARLDAYPYDVSPNGRRFVLNTLVEERTSTTITVVLNWTAVLSRP